MLTIDRDASCLFVVDFQSRLMPAIPEAAAAIAQATRLLEAARLLDVPVLVTEQNPKGLGSTVSDLPVEGRPILHKMAFDATREPAFAAACPDRPAVVVAGCEAHVCVLQTVLGLLDGGRRVYVARDAVAARRPESKETALARMARHGAEIVTTEMVLFEWLGSAEHPRFRDAIALVK
jgi:nicotinamidase-related amidase